MKTFRTLIIDDERLGREELKLLLKDFLEVEIVDEAKNGEEGIRKIKELKPDLVFLDISMPGMTGFEMLRKLEEIPRVIFVTAYDEFALKAFDVNALDYILKPVDPERLKDAIQKLTSKEDDFISSENVAFGRKERLLSIT
ncbi:MAG: LytR/AlgR family response regulator transcription factor, partial [Bacteroidota bacterium]